MVRRWSNGRETKCREAAEYVKRAENNKTMRKEKNAKFALQAKDLDQVASSKRRKSSFGGRTHPLLFDQHKIFNLASFS